MLTILIIFQVQGHALRTIERVPAMYAGGHRFEVVILQKISPSVSIRALLFEAAK